MKDKKSSPDSSGPSSATPKDSHYARLRRQFRDQKAGVSEQNSQSGYQGNRFDRRKAVKGTPAEDGIIRLYGLHTVKAAIENPVAWTGKNSFGGKVFMTTLGHPDDFKLEAFQRLVINAIHWELGKKVPKTWKGKMDIQVPYREAK